MTFLIALGLTLAAVPASLSAQSPSTDKVWIIIKPLQCLGNPWEKEWLAKHKQGADKFPRRREFTLMRDYFRRKKVDVLELRVKPYGAGEYRCEACDCPRGDTVYMLIHADDVPKVVRLGYTERAPASAIPKKK